MKWERLTELLCNILQCDPRVSQIDPSQPSTDDIVAEAHDEVVGLVSIEHSLVLLRHNTAGTPHYPRQSAIYRAASAVFHHQRGE
jgi:hypothetical protein